MISTGTAYGYNTSKGRLAISKKQAAQIRKSKKQQGYYFTAERNDPDQPINNKGRRMAKQRKTSHQKLQ